MPAAITVENLSKAYRIGLKEESHDSLVGALQGALKAPWKNWRQLRRLNTYGGHADEDDTHWALRDVSFEVQEGEVLGIIGRNGAGKSTLLKILSRITEPTSGRAVIRGRVSSLLEVGTGFHQELSGRENVYLNGTILGMTKREIDRKFDEIVDFSGVEKFLDTPIKRYSSGMKVRLAFAVAAHLEPEILIIDEVLAVGDAEFQRKCLGKMQDVAQGGRTVLFVSHNMGAMQSLCTHGVLLEQGATAYQGDIRETIKEYLFTEALSSTWEEDDATIREHLPDVRIRRAELHTSSAGSYDGALRMGDGLCVRIYLEVGKSDRHYFIGLGIYDAHGMCLSTMNSADSDVGTALDGSEFKPVVECIIPELNLMPGKYYLNLSVLETRSRDCVDYISQAIGFDIIASGANGHMTVPRGSGIIYFTSSWRKPTYTAL